jgi:hypothetical protein
VISSVRKYIGFKDNEFEFFQLIIQNKFLNEATEEYIMELDNRISEFDFDLIDAYITWYKMTY